MRDSLKRPVYDYLDSHISHQVEAELKRIKSQIVLSASLAVASLLGSVALLVAAWRF